MIIGIAYHSPLDVVTLFPTDIKYTLNPDDSADVLISETFVKNYKSRVQLVFTSARNLFKENLPIIDQGAWGKVISLTSLQLEEILKKKQQQNNFAPDWVSLFKRR